MISIYLQERATGIRRFIRKYYSNSPTAPQELLLYYDSFLQKLSLGKYFFLIAVDSRSGKEEIYALNGGDDYAKGKDI